MKLSLNFALDQLEEHGVAIVAERIEDLGERRLIASCIYAESLPFRNDILYICQANDLADAPMPQGKAAIICIGNLPARFERAGIEYICVDGDVEIAYVFNLATALFRKWNEWDEKLRDAIIERASYHQIGTLLYRAVDNPVMFSDAFFKNVFVVNEPSRGLDQGYVTEYVEGEYLAEDERMVLMSNEHYTRAGAELIPQIFPRGMYRYDILYFDIMIEKSYLGRMIIDVIYHPLRRADSEILVYFAELFKRAYLQNEAVSVGQSFQFENMVMQLCSPSPFYDPAFSNVLGSYDWRRNDSYRVCSLTEADEASDLTVLTRYAIYLRHLVGNCYPCIVDKAILLIINLAEVDSDSVQLKKIDRFCRTEDLYSGISQRFNDFAQIGDYRNQSIEALRIGRKLWPWKRSHEFDNLILDRMLNVLKQDGPVLYVSDALRTLVDYDSAHSGELIETLRTALEHNMAATECSRVLHIYRTTYLYRMKRIEEITGLDLGMPRVRLYLAIALELIGEEHGLQGRSD